MSHRRKPNSRSMPNRVVASLGDVSPEYGGTIVYRNRYGLHVTHWESDNDDDERAPYTVWTTCSRSTAGPSRRLSHKRTGWTSRSSSAWAARASPRTARQRWR